MRRLFLAIVLLAFAVNECKAQTFEYGQVCYDTSEYTQEDWDVIDEEGIDVCWGAGTTFTVHNNTMDIFDDWNMKTTTVSITNCGVVDGFLILQDDKDVWKLSDEEGTLVGIQVYLK